MDVAVSWNYIPAWVLDPQAAFNERYRQRLAAWNRAFPRESNKGGPMPSTDILIEESDVETTEYVITLSEEAAGKLRRAMNFNLTIRDRVTARDGERDGYSMFHFMAEVDTKLKDLGVSRWKRS